MSVSLSVVLTFVTLLVLVCLSESDLYTGRNFAAISLKLIRLVDNRKSLKPIVLGEHRSKVKVKVIQIPNFFYFHHNFVNFCTIFKNLGPCFSSWSSPELLFQQLFSQMCHFVSMSVSLLVDVNVAYLLVLASNLQQSAGHSFTRIPL